MISVVIPTLDDEARLGATLGALVPAAVDGLVREVIVADGGSTDATLAIADDAGARVAPAEQDLGRRLATGCAAAKNDWLLILLPGVRLERGWEAAAETHLADGAGKAGYFQMVLEGQGERLRQHLARILVTVSGRPEPEQGLLIARTLYDGVGGFRAKEAPRGLADRLGRSRLAALKARIFVPR